MYLALNLPSLRGGGRRECLLPTMTYASVAPGVIKMDMNIRFSPLRTGKYCQAGPLCILRHSI